MHVKQERQNFKRQVCSHCQKNSEIFDEMVILTLILKGRCSYCYTGYTLSGGLDVKLYQLELVKLVQMQLFGGAGYYTIQLCM